MGRQLGNNRRALALDLGTKRTGIALSDRDASLASPLETVELSLRKLISHLRARILENDVCVVVIGFPAQPSGELSEIGLLAHEVAKRLSKIPDLQVVLWDETLTSWEAEQILAEQGRDRRQGVRGRRGKKRAYDPGEVDRVAASLILQDYLDNHPPDRKQ